MVKTSVTFCKKEASSPHAFPLSAWHRFVCVCQGETISAVFSNGVSPGVRMPSLPALSVTSISGASSRLPCHCRHYFPPRRSRCHEEHHVCPMAFWAALNASQFINTCHLAYASHLDVIFEYPAICANKHKTSKHFLRGTVHSKIVIIYSSSCSKPLWLLFIFNYIKYEWGLEFSSLKKGTLKRYLHLCI